MEIEEIVKIIIVCVVLAVLVWITVFLFKGKGGDILEAIKNLFKFGG